jgi:hypothetical protein
MDAEVRQQIEDILVELAKMNIYVYTAMKQIEEVWNKAEADKEKHG